MFDSIIFLTDRYPFGTGEAFIHNELPYILNACKKLYIIPVNARDYSYSRLTENDKICIWKGNKKTSVTYKVLKSPMQFFDKTVRDEIRYLRNCNKMNHSSVGLLLYFSIEYKRIAKTVQKWMRGKIEPDEKVLIYSYWLYNTAYVGSLLKKQFLKSSLVSRGHRFDIYLERNQNNYLPLRQYIISRMDRIFPISNDGTRYLCSLYPGVKEKTFTKRLGTLDHGYNPEKSTDVLKIVSCSNLIPVKRVHLIIEILKHMKERVIWTHFGDGSEREVLTDTAERVLPDCVTVEFRGNVPNDDLMKLYTVEHFDVFLNVSESEGIPVSIMEAISFGIPVIATNVGGTAEIVQDGVNGYLIDSYFEPEDVVQKIQDITKDMRLKARQFWEENYNAEINYSAFFEKL